MAKVKNLTIADMVDGQWYVVKTKNTKKNGALVHCKKGDKGGVVVIYVNNKATTQDDIEWAYKTMEGQKFVYNGKPNQQLRTLWPAWPKDTSPNIALWEELKDVEFTEGDFLYREDQEEHYVKNYFDKENYKNAYGLNVAWLDPTFVPEFRDNKYKYLFQPVEIALPKSALGLSELKTISAVQESYEQMAAKYNGNANFILCNADGSKNSTHFNSACHASLSSCKKIKYVLSAAHGAGNKQRSEELVWYVNYLVNLSPFRDAFISKDAEKIVEDNCYIISGDAPGNIVGLACIATRQPWEYPGMVKSFYSLSELGAPLHVAFMAANSAGNTSFTRSYSGHSVLPTDDNGDASVLNYIEGKAVQADAASYFTSGNYRGCCGVYGKGGGKTFFNGLANLTKGDGWKEKAIEWDDLMKLAAQFLQEWCNDNY